MSALEPHCGQNWPAELTSAASLLLQAVQLADEVPCSWWNFAVETAELQRLGITNNAMRLLICRGLVDHAEEVDASRLVDRMFQPTARLSIVPRTCFVLTQAGREAAERLLATRVHQQSTNVSPGPDGFGQVPSASDVIAARIAANSLHKSLPLPHERPHVQAQSTTERNASLAALAARLALAGTHELKPVWDVELNRLCFGSLIVKEYRTPAPNQQRILSAFQEEGWPPRIDDPLPPERDLEPKRRLHETIISLNRNQRNRVMRFGGDGHGEGVVWRQIPG